ncbi:hypothetical protein GJ496_009455 [Pomphorhynchus laevis]|nr:hypothetical protein GJ496_009455 [Pomphorhynchus laevis]
MFLKARSCSKFDDAEEFTGQNLNDIAKLSKHTKKLFEDTLFPACNKSLGYQKNGTYPKINWMRPSEIYSEPKFFISFPTRRDPVQGTITNCWLVSAISSLTQFPKIFEHVVPSGQSFDSSKGYFGAFYFRIWHDGKWSTVVVDDRLPILSKYQKPLGMTSRYYPKEFWCSLLEKAYAKLYGGYYNLEGGTASEALIDLTGGISQKCNLKTYCKRINGSQTLFEYIKRSLSYHCMMGCSISPQEGKYKAEEILKNGLVVGHSYCILRCENVSWLGNHTDILRLRNPWGNNVKWNGQWSSKDDRWNFVKADVRLRLSIGEQADGEFWISYSDWINNYDVLEVCHLSPDSLSRENLIIEGQENVKEWNCRSYYGCWQRDISAGGRCDKPCTHGCRYWDNPCVSILVNDIGVSRHTFVFCLSQINKRLQSVDDPSERFEYIQLRLYAARILSNGEIIVKKNDYIDSSGPYVNRRDISFLVTLDNGWYILFASTYDPGIEGDFIIRVFTDSDSSYRKQRTYDIPLGYTDESLSEYIEPSWNCCQHMYPVFSSISGVIKSIFSQSHKSDETTTTTDSNIS